MKTKVLKAVKAALFMQFDTKGRNVSSITVGVRLVPGVDWRCNGGYVVVPPSTINGKEYKIINDKEPISCPQPLIDCLLLRQKSKKILKVIFDKGSCE